MEPLAKRLRIHRSVDVDETNLDYILKKQRAERQLRNQWERIFSKYENMPEWMSDEIDMRNNKVVVERGHLRSKKDSARGWEPVQLLGEMMPRVSNAAVDEYDEDSLDELAPQEMQRPHKLKNVQSPEHQKSTAPGTTQSTLATETHSTAIPLETVHHAPPTSTISPAQFLQFPPLPQTSERQQTHNAFLAGLNHAISQAISQYTAQALSTYFGNQVTGTTVMPNVATPLNTTGPAPATESKWWFPSFMEQANQQTLPQSSPISATAHSRKRRTSFERDISRRFTKRRPVSSSLQYSSNRNALANVPQARAPFLDCDELSAPGSQSHSQQDNQRAFGSGQGELHRAKDGSIEANTKDQEVRPKHDAVAAVEDMTKTVPIEPRQLLTPSSSKVLDMDAQDIELLSIVDSPASEEELDCRQSSVGSHDIVLPSIESTASPFEEKDIDPWPISLSGEQTQLPQRREISEAIETLQEPPDSTPQSSRKKRPGTTLKSIKFIVESDSEDVDHELVQIHTSPAAPTVKREPSTPARAALHSVPLFCTPKSAPQPRLMSTAKLSAKERRQIRQQWARAGRKPESGLAARPKRSLQALRKLSASNDESGDELAL